MVPYSLEIYQAPRKEYVTVWLTVAIVSILILIAAACMLVGAVDATEQREQWSKEQRSRALDSCQDD